MSRGSAFRLWLGCFVVIALLNAAQLYIAFGHEGLPFVIALRWSIIDWGLWALLWPLIAWLVRVQPLSQARLWRSLAVHAPASIILGTLQLAVFCAIEKLLPGPSPTSPMSTLQLITKELERRLHFQIFIYFVVVAIVSMIEDRRARADRERRASQLEARLAEARLAALKAQLQPHFLFNTLHAISALMHRDLDAAERMIARLSELLRLSLDTDAQEVPLARELDLLGPYLEIEQIRFQDRLTVHLDVASDARGALVPALVLQPLVENAIRHGLAPRAAAGRIDIRARREGTQLRLEVADDGVGTTDAAPPRERVGLGNTRARLEQLYGAGHTLEIGPGERGGLRVSVSIPYRTAGTPA